jgi:hypothetical protein
MRVCFNRVDKTSKVSCELEVCEPLVRLTTFEVWQRFN